ncbi:hypothetical protein AAD018_007630 [Aestuariibius insulae]|uniref:hypothetical protein n=1 Tax=Aestuariibius insulae TaxID=2058287 RepID=UPI00345E4A76
MDPRWLMSAKRWVQNPPSRKKVYAVLGIIAFCACLYGLEQAGALPDWMQAERGARIPR